MKKIINFYHDYIFPSIIFLLVIGGFIFVSFKLFNKVIIPTMIKERSHNLNLMRYDSKSDQFVPKDTIILSREELYYLQYGKFEK